MQRVGSETREFWWDPRNETHLTGGTLDPQGGTRDLDQLTHIKGGTRDACRTTLKVEPGTLKEDFQKIFLLCEFHITLS